MLGRINALGVGQLFAPVAGTATADPAESSVVQLSPATTIVARDLAIKLTAAPGAGQSRTFTLRDDGAATGLSCTISDTATSCTSGAASATIGPASELAIHATSSALAVPASALFGWRATS